MSSTEPDRDALLAAFFREHLAPAAEKLKARGVELVEPGPDAGAESYWHTREEGRAALVALDFDRLDESLRALWAAHPELADLAGPLADLARVVEEERGEALEVDEFVYQMF